MNRYPNSDIGPIVSVVTDCANAGFDATTFDIALTIADWEGMDEIDRETFACRAVEGDADLRYELG